MIDGVLTGTSNGADPRLTSPAKLSIPVQNLRKVAIRMAVSEAGKAQLFWTSFQDENAFSSRKQMEFDTTAGEAREYIVNLDAHPEWTGVLTRLRFDPAVTSGVDFRIESIRLLP